MLAKINEAKIKKFFSVVTRLSEKFTALPIAMIVSKKDVGADVVALSGMSNRIVYLRADKNSDEVELIVELVKSLEKRMITFLEIGDFLHPTIYNAIYLLSSSGRIEYNTQKDRIVARPAKGATLILFTNENNLNKLNYDNLLNFVGLIERI